MTIDIPEGYEALGLALGEAVAQAACGKGSERHAEKGEKFSDQLIMSIPKRLGEGGECFCLGQALKKICESRRLPQARARAELLGAINYLAAAWSLLGGTESVSAPESPKASGSVCLDFAERVVSLMKEAGVREVSFASPGACIRADGIVTGLHFTTESVSAPEDFEFDEARMRESMPGIVPQEDRESPLFPEGTPVEFLPEERGVWEPALYRGLDSDGGHLVAARGGVLACVPADRIRKPEDAAAPLFPERAPVECRPPLESEWSPALYIGVDPAGYHIVECRGVRMHLSADAVRKPEDADRPRFQQGELVEYRSDGKWKPASFMHMDGGYAVLMSGGERIEVLAFDVRPAEKS